nr:hairy/enhancer-of-split related with YRPW motif protein-like [Cherax quadricarinatus]
MTPLFQTQVRPGMLLCAFLCVLACVVSTTVEIYYGAVFTGSLAVIFFIMSCQQKPIASEPIADVNVTSAITHYTARQQQQHQQQQHQQQQHQQQHSTTQQLDLTQPPSYTSQTSYAAHPLYPSHIQDQPPSPHTYPHEATLPAYGQQLTVYETYTLDPAYGAYTRSSIVFQSSTDGLPTYEEATTINISSNKSAKE